MKTTRDLRRRLTAYQRGPGMAGPQYAFPSQHRRLFAAACFVAAATFAIFGTTTFTQYQACLVAAFGIVAVGQDLLLGRAGQISLGVAALMAVGAYTTARLSTVSWAWFPVPTVVSGVFGLVVGLIIGITGLRFRGLYLALSTLALQFIVAFLAQEYQGSNEGGFTVDPPKFAGYVFDSDQSLLILALILLALITLALGGLYRRAPGRAWAAIRQNEIAASVAGVNSRNWKLLAFSCSSCVTAIGGSIYAYVIGNVNYTAFNLDLTVSVLVMVFVGGLGSLSGALVGAVFVGLLPYFLQIATTHLQSVPSVSQWLLVNGSELSSAIYGLALVLVLVFERGGIMGLLLRLERAWRKALDRARVRRTIRPERG